MHTATLGPAVSNAYRRPRNTPRAIATASSLLAAPMPSPRASSLVRFSEPLDLATRRTPKVRLAIQTCKGPAVLSASRTSASSVS